MASSMQLGHRRGNSLLHAVGPSWEGLMLVLEAGMVSMETLIQGFTRQATIGGHVPVLRPEALQHIAACAMSMLLVLRDAQVMHGGNLDAHSQSFTVSFIHSASQLATQTGTC